MNPSSVLEISLAGSQFYIENEAEQEAEEALSDKPRSRKAPTENMGLPFSVYLVEEA